MNYYHKDRLLLKALLEVAPCKYIVALLRCFSTHIIIGKSMNFLSLLLTFLHLEYKMI